MRNLGRRFLVFLLLVVGLTTGGLYLYVRKGDTKFQQAPPLDAKQKADFAPVPDSTMSDQRTEKDKSCVDLSSTYEVCLKQTGPQDDYWGARTTTEFTEVNRQTGRTRLLYSQAGFPPDILGHTENKVYYKIEGYEGSGSGTVFMIDISTAEVTKITINAYGLLSPDGRYYVTYGDTERQNGARFCNSPALNGSQLPASALKLLSLDTGKVRTIKEDRNKIFQVNSWSKSSESVFYTTRTVKGQFDADRCPVYENPQQGEINIIS